jgi:hypothetical protein
MRTSFFSCSLSPSDDLGQTEREKLQAYESYITSFRNDRRADDVLNVSSLADTRSSLLELSQFRNFEFDTLRRAKYSTSMLLYHLLKSNAPGTVPSCSLCRETIKEVRWHKVKKIREITKPTSCLASTTTIEDDSFRYDLCSSCLSNTKRQDNFIPIPVSTKSVENGK